MDKYLLEILKEINTIIIPGLGALTITDASTGEIMFMTYLKHDDGQLAKHIAEKDGLDETEAKNLIAKYVREITAKLDQGESYDMFQFGSFYKNDSGDVDFKGWDKTQDEKPAKSAKKEKEEKPAVKKKEVAKNAEKKTEEKKSTTKKEPTKKPAAKKESTTKKEAGKKDAPVKETVKETKAEKPVEKKEEPIIQKEKVEKAEPVKKELNIEQKEELAQNQQKLEVLKKTQEEPEAKRKKGAGFYILLVLITIIGAGSIYVAFNYDEVKQHIPFLADNKEPDQQEPDPLEEMKEIINGEADISEEDSQASEETSNQEESTESDSEEMIEETKEEVVVEEEAIEEEISSPPPSSGSGNYHIIAGAFSSEANAERLASKFREAGYNVTVGMVNGLNMVSIGSYATSSDAQKALPDMKSSAPSAWVYSGTL